MICGSKSSWVVFFGGMKLDESIFFGPAFRLAGSKDMQTLFFRLVILEGMEVQC